MTNKADQILDFLRSYSDQVVEQVLGLRQVVLANLPNITEQIDLPAKMIAYSYGQKYAELICVIIPSKKGLKLGFNRGSSLPDPDKILEGAGKISRYVIIKSVDQIDSPAIQSLLKAALVLYNELKVK